MSNNVTVENKRMSFFFDHFDLYPEGYREADRILSLAQDISNTYIWVLFAIGVPANIITIVTITTMQATSPVTFFVALLAALDGTSLIAKLAGHQMIRHDVYIGNLGCKFEFIILFFVTSANWVLVLICAERFFTVCFPAKKSAIFTMKNCYTVTGVLAAVLFGIFAGISVPMRTSASLGLRCGTYIQYRWFWIHVWYWINATLYLFIPFLCVFVMTAMMVHTLHTFNRKVNRATETEPDKKDTGSPTGTQSVTETELAVNEGGFTLMITVAALFFVVLSLPACVYYLSYLSLSRSDDRLTKARWALFGQVQHLLADATHAVNFFLYFLSATTFRSQFLKLLLPKRCLRSTCTTRQSIA